MNTSDIHEHFRSRGTWVNWDHTADRVTAGDPSHPIGKVAVSWKASWDVLATFTRWTSPIAGSIPGLFMLAMLTRRGNATGAIIGVLVAAGTNVLLQNLTDIHWQLLPAMTLCIGFVVGYVASIATGGCKRDLSELSIWNR